MSETTKRVVLVRPEEVNTAPGREFFIRKTEKFFDACPECKGTCVVQATEGLLGKIGARRSCPLCSQYANHMKNFCNKFFATVPLRYQGCIWSELQPSTKSVLPLDTQKEHMDYFRRYSDQSAAFFGSPGTSKTTWMTAMYAQQCWWETGQDIWRTGGLVYRMTTKALLDQFTQYALRGNDPENPADPPRLSRERIEKIARLDRRVSLFLEELDKIKQTDSRMANLFEVVDALYESKGQLVVSSNLTLPQFQDQFGEVFARRISEMCKIVNLWEEKQ
jgi:hypothetical protein